MTEGRKNRTSDAENKTKIASQRKTPHGREAIKKAILDATEKLLLRKSPRRITVREIAETANIKHPLIHRYFGTKDDVIIAVHARGIAKIEHRIAKLENIEGNIGIFFEAIRRSQFRQVALTRAMIDGVSPRIVQKEFPVTGHLLKLIKKRCGETDSDEKFTPEMMTAFLGAAVLGWILYEPFLLAATNQEDKDRAEIHETLVLMFEEIVRRLC